MKKLFLIAAVAVSGLVSAQKVNFGAKAGLNLANFTGDDLEDLKTRTSLYAGGYANIPLVEKLSFQPELLFSSQGTKLEDNFAGSEFKAVIQVNYLNLPLMFQYEIAEGFKAEAGPQIGFLVSAKQKTTVSYTFEGESETESETEDIKENFKSIDFGLNIGLNYELKNGLNFGARYNLGLSNIAEDSGDNKVKNAVISVGVGYTFGKK
jgi:long-subunit fatty acid transport protein